jgi:hypothetical protein
MNLSQFPKAPSVNAIQGEKVRGAVAPLEPKVPSVPKMARYTSFRTPKIPAIGIK